MQEIKNGVFQDPENLDFAKAIRQMQDAKEKGEESTFEILATESEKRRGIKRIGKIKIEGSSKKRTSRRKQKV